MAAVGPVDSADLRLCGAAGGILLIGTRPACSCTSFQDNASIVLMVDVPPRRVDEIEDQPRLSRIFAAYILRFAISAWLFNAAGSRSIKSTQYLLILVNCVLFLVCNHIEKLLFPRNNHDV
jgi:hypothetical protein